MELKQRLTRLSKIQRYNSYQDLLHITMNVCLSSFFFGYCSGYFNSIRFSDIVKIFNIQSQNLSLIQGTLTGIVPLVGAVGCYITSLFLSRFSRIQCFNILGIGIIITSFILLIPNLTILFFARIIQGLLIGVSSVITPLYIKQISPIQLAGSLCPWYGIGFFVGLAFSFTFTFLCSLIFPVQFYWRICFFLPAITAFIQMYNFKKKYPYQTPKYWILKRNQLQTKELLRFIYKKQFADGVFDDLKKALFGITVAVYTRTSRISKLTQQDMPQLQRLSFKNNLNQLQKRMTQTQMFDFKLQQKIKPIPQKNTQTSIFAKLVSVHISIVQQGACGAAIVSYSGQIIGRMAPSIQKIFPVGVSFSAMIGTFVCIYLMNKFGRKTILIYCQLIIGTILVLICVCLKKCDFQNPESNGLLLTVVLCFLIAFIRFVTSSTSASVGTIYISQTVQPVFLPYAIMFSWSLSGIINVVFPILNQKLDHNPAYIFLGFGVYCILTGILNSYILVQTKNKKQYQINHQIQEKWKKLTGK